VNGQKMSKSLGNSLLLTDLVENYSDEAVKFALLQTNYRNDVNVTDDLFPEAEKHIFEFYSVLNAADEANLTATADDIAAAKKIDDEFNACMNDDFNTALALSNLFGYFKELKKQISEKNGLAAAYAMQLRKTYGLLGFFYKAPKEYLAWFEKKNAVEIPADVKAVAEERWAARTARDWAKSDELRAKLMEMGYVVKDSKTGYELIKN
jgi:cysteinyl-tRNA synthetase